MIVTMDEVAKWLEQSREVGNGGRCLYDDDGRLGLAKVDTDGTHDVPEAAVVICTWPASRAWDGLTAGEWAMLDGRLKARGHKLKMTEGRYDGNS